MNKYKEVIAAIITGILGIVGIIIGLNYGSSNQVVQPVLVTSSPTSISNQTTQPTFSPTNSSNQTTQPTSSPTGISTFLPSTPKDSSDTSTNKEYKEVTLYNKPYLEASHPDVVKINDKSLILQNINASNGINTKKDDGYTTGMYYVTYPLNGKAKKLMSSFSLVDSSYGDTFEVQVSVYDENNKLLYKSLNLKTSMEEQNFDIDVSNVLQVKLQVQLKNNSSTEGYACVSPTFSKIRVLTTDY